MRWPVRREPFGARHPPSLGNLQNSNSDHVPQYHHDMPSCTTTTATSNARHPPPPAAQPTSNPEPLAPAAGTSIQRTAHFWPFFWGPTRNYTTRHQTPLNWGSLFGFCWALTKNQISKFTCGRLPKRGLRPASKRGEPSVKKGCVLPPSGVSHQPKRVASCLQVG